MGKEEGLKCRNHRPVNAVKGACIEGFGFHAWNTKEARNEDNLKHLFAFSGKACLMDSSGRNRL